MGALVPSPYRLYSAADGTVVKAGDPRALTLFACVGALVDEDILSAFAPVSSPEPEAPAPKPEKPAAKAIKKPAANKAVKGPKKTK